MGAGQIRDVDRDRTDLVDPATIHAEPALDDEATDLGLFDPLERFADHGLLRLVRAQGLEDLVEDSTDRFGAGLLVVRLECGDEPGRREVPHARLELEVAARRRIERPPRLSGLAHQLLLQPRQLFRVFVAEGDRVQHGRFGDFLRSRFDHEHGLLGSGHDELDRGSRLLAGGGIGDEFTIHETDADRPDRTVERDAGERQRRGRAVHGEHVRVILLIPGDHEADDLDLVPEAFREQGTDRPVDQAGGQRLLHHGRAFALEVPARDAAASIRALAVLHRQGKEVLRVSRGLGADAGRQHHRAAVADDDRAIGLLGDLAGLDGEREAVDVERYGMRHTN